MNLKSLLTFSVLLSPAFGQWGQETLTAFDTPPYPENIITDYEIRTGDVDGDGRLDVMLMHPYIGSFRWLRNTPSGTWPKTYIGNDIFNTYSTYVLHWEMTDVDSDGDLDLIAGGSPTAVATAWFENQASGTQWVTHLIDMPTGLGGSGVVGIDMADLDGDGDKDLLINSRGGNPTMDRILLYEASPTGLNFSQVLDSKPWSNSLRVMLTDVDGDGDVDFGHPDTDLANSEWYENQSTPGQFQFGLASYQIPSKTTDALDWDGDGNLDMVESEERSVQIRLNTAPGTFGAPLPIMNATVANAASIRVSRVEVTDMDGDGDKDLVFRWGIVVGYGWQAVVENKSDGSPGDRTDFAQAGWNLTYNSWSVVDYDGDGDKDIVDTGPSLSVGLQRNLMTFGQQSPCQAFPNSTGLTGHIDVTGSGTAEVNATTLTASQMIPGKLTLFLIGDTDTSGVIPPGSQGAFCLGGSFGRFNRPGEFMLADGTGSAQLSLDLTNIPGPMGIETVLPGETRVFQAWFRDDDTSGNPTSNFTDAVVVPFN